LRFSGFEKPALLAAAFRRLFRGGSCASSGVAAAEGDLFTGNKGATGTEAGDEGREVSRADMIRFQSVVLRRRWRLIHTQTDLQKLSIVNVNLRAAQNALCRNNNDWPLLPSFIVLSVLAGGLKSVWNAHRAIPMLFLHLLYYTISVLSTRIWRTSNIPGLFKRTFPIFSDHVPNFQVSKEYTFPQLQQIAP
jgi:hypothetical protein